MSSTKHPRLTDIDVDQLVIPETATMNSNGSIKFVNVKLGNGPFEVQFNGKNDLWRAPYGIDRDSELYPNPEKRFLRLMVPPEAVEKLNAISDKVVQQFAANHALWGCAPDLQFYPLVKMDDEKGPMAKFRVHLKDTPIKRFNPNMTAVKKADYKVINPGSECVILVKSASIWIADDKYGVTLTPGVIFVKPGEKKQYGLNDMDFHGEVKES